VRHIYYIAIQMVVFMIALEKFVCFCAMRPVFIAKLHLPIAYLYYLMVPTVKDYEHFFPGLDVMPFPTTPSTDGKCAGQN